MSIISIKNAKYKSKINELLFLLILEFRGCQDKTQDSQDYRIQILR